MKVLKDVFGRIWAIWGMLLFIVTMFVFMIPYLLIDLVKEPRRTVLFISISKWWMRVFLTGIGCPLIIKGKRQFKPGRNYIVVCNHNSLMDVPVSCPFIPGGNKTIAKLEMAKTPVFGRLYKMGSVLVDRQSEKSRRESYLKMKQVLEMGLHMSIYPEGTRNKSSEPLKPFHDGAFRLAIDTGKEIIPALIFNTRKVMPSNRNLYLWPHTLEMHFLEPVAATESDTVDTLKQRVFNLMRTYYVAHNR